MIGRLRGTLLEKQAPELLLDVGGVGYEVSVPMTSLYQLPAIGEVATLHTHLVVREDAQQLFGFCDLRSRELFRTLIKVNGVGPKLALTILSGMDSDEFVRCIRDGNVAALVSMPGVGKKTAERLVVEMGDRLKDWDAGDVAATAPTAAGDHLAEAEAALIALGYKPAEAGKAVNAVASDADTVEEVIRLALRTMVKT